MSISSRRLRRIAGVLMAVVLAATTATACSGKKSTAGASGPLELFSDNPTWQKGFTDAGEALKKLTGHGLAPASLPSTANYEQVVRTSVGTKKTKDLVKWWSGYKLQDLASTGNLTDLTDVWNAAEQKGWLDPALKPAYTFNGKVYGLPMYQSYWVVFYSKPIFAKYNLKPPTTFAQFESVMGTLKQNGVTPLYTTQSGGWPSFIMYQSLVAGQSPDFYNDLTANKAKWTDPTSTTALKIWKGWIDKGWTTSPDADLADAPAQMKAGKVAMTPIGTWDNGGFKAAGLTPGTDYAAFFMPTVTPDAKKSAFVEGGAWTVPKNAPNHEAAVKQISNWLDPSVQTVWSNYLGDNSANPTVIPTDPLALQVSNDVKAQQPMLLNRFYEAFPSKLVVAATDQLDGFMVHPDTGGKVLATIQSSADTEWDNWKKQVG
jgi:multiple sugar transport system substrate-binding protein